MPDVSSAAPAAVRLGVVFDVHKHSIVAGTLPPVGGTPEVQRIENTERAIRRLDDRLGGPDGLARPTRPARAVMTCCGCWTVSASRVT